MIKVVLALVFIVILVAPGLTWWVAQRPVPLLDGVGEVNGMSKPVLVRYDGRAIPYIKAESDADAYAAQGYVVARERMFQMDMLRRAAEGRIAQVFGITALPTDRLMRTIGFERLAEKELGSLTPQAKSALEAYCRGVNAYLTESSDKLPAEFTVLGYKPDPWKETDTLAIMKYLAYELDESWKLDELRFRITNKVGDNLASRLFDDNLAVTAWSPDAKNSSALVKPVAATQSASPTNANALRPANRALGTTQNPAAAQTVRRRSLAPVSSPRRAPSAELAPPTSNPSSTPATPSTPNTDTTGGPHARLIEPSLSDGLKKLASASEFFRKTDPSWGSTAWVLAPAFSKSGGAMLAADKHSALTNPCEYFLCSLSSANLHVAGASIPGVPGIIFGRNAQIAWSGASMHADVQDLFVEHFASEVDTKYKTLSKVETAEEFREAIPVRFGQDVDHKVTITSHGPVLLRDKESAIALSWTGFETKKPWLNTLCAINRASDWNSFNQAISAYGGPSQLFVFADKRGNVACHGAGILPVRAGGAQGTTMSEGWLSKGEWVASVDYEDLPQLFIQAASSGKPSGDFCVAAGQKLYAAPGTSGQFPQLWGHQWDAPYRANRLALSLPRGKGAAKLDLLDFNAYQGDELNMLANYVVAELKKSLDANKSIDAGQRRAMELMQHWDFNVKRESAAASCYESFMGTLARRLLEPKLGRDMTNEYFQNWPLWITFVEDYLRNKPKDLLPPEERTHDTFMLTTFAKANTRLQLLFKSDKVDTWTWEKAHLANFKAVGVQGVSWLRSILDLNGVGVSGDGNCLNACDVDRVSVGGAFQSNNGPSVRLLIDMADDDVFYGILSLGQSGHYFSPFRQDQLKSWLRADALPIAFSEAKVDGQCRQKFYLSAPGYR